jgi:hypothetical protein
MLKSLRIDIDEVQRNELKIYCVRNNVSIRDYIISLIRADWAKDETLPQVW